MTYASLAEFRLWAAIDDSYDDDNLQIALDDAVDAVNNYCGRVFTVDASATVRTVKAEDLCLLTLRSGLGSGLDISTTTGLIVKTDDNDDGSYETTWTLGTDFVTVGDGYGPNGQANWPFFQLRAVGSKYWPVRTNREAVQITAKFGWAAVPSPVKLATLILAVDAFKAKDVTFGNAGFGEFGPLRVRDNQMATSRLRRYVHPIHAAVSA